MSRLIPRTLPAWVLIILIAVLLVSQTTSFLIMSRDRLASSEVVDLYSLNERAFWLAKLLGPLNAEERRRVSTEIADSTVVVNLSTLPAINTNVSPSDKLAELEDILVSRLSRFDVVDARVRLDPPGPVDVSTTVVSDGNDNTGQIEEDLTEVARDFLKTERYTVSLQFKDGQWLNFVTPATPIGPILASDSLPLYLIIGICVVVLAFWAVWRLAAPYQVLEAAVARLGADLNSPPIPETGGKDYRSAARALNDMQAKLQEYVEERELVAASLAHDLRTPVTRMRLRLALLRDSDLHTALAGDIGQIERTVQSVIDFAKLNISDEPAERLDFWSLVDAVADEYDEVILEPPQSEQPRLICCAPPV
ncbi:MAG TPA: histidine kinase dimerization/phospho-acceptor domain-containing protein, partial [Rhizobium sp.]